MKKNISETQDNKRKPTTTLQQQQEQGFALPSRNYKYLIIGFLIIITGFILMTGGKSASPNEFNPEIFSFRRITLAPMVVLSGFIFVIWAIMHKTADTKEE